MTRPRFPRRWWLAVLAVGGIGAACLTVLAAASARADVPAAWRVWP